MNSKHHKTRLRIGAVNYLNSKPLVYELARRAPFAEVTYDLPSRLADSLAAGRLDVALIPSIESVQQPGYRVVSDACIGCRGPVLSVKLFSRTPIEKIRTVALDEGSRTSAALVQILLARQFQLRPKLEPLPIGSGADATTADAVLLIGDRAMHSPPSRFAVVWDLGDQWCRITGLPFVFAMWTARPGVNVEPLEEVLSEVRDAGVAHIDQIAAVEAAPLGLTEPQCRDYLRNNLNFFLGPGEQQGLELFLRYAAELGLAPLDVDLGFNHCKTAG
ncbi:MAG: menaquinone biosynthesis protein [Planctomycetia bacterium]|nr:menaquinone biosynthesis protein [Planctomycetia bacterium]